MTINKFKTNKFAKKYKEELEKNGYIEDLEQSEFIDEIMEGVDQVKSWKRSSISQTINLTYIFLAFIIGFSVCAVVMTPIIINLVIKNL